MSPSRGTAGRGASSRSGDPRRRVGTASAAATSPAAGPDRRWAVGAAIAVGVVAVVLALLSLRPDDATPRGAAGSAAGGTTGQVADPDALTHAESACTLTTQAGEAAEAVDVDARSRYAAAVLLLDRAILDSARAAEGDARLTGLDAALQAVHTAGHAGDADRWEAALATALTECRTALG